MPVVFDNRKRAVFYRISSFLITIVVIIFITIIFFSGFIPKDAIIFNRQNLFLVVIVSYLLFGLYRYWLNLHYFFFSDKGEYLIFRFYSLRPFSNLRNSIEIPKNSLGIFKIKTDFTGKKPMLYLSQKTIEGNKQFPPIKLSALKKKEIKSLERILEKYSMLAKEE